MTDNNIIQELQSEIKRVKEEVLPAYIELRGLHNANPEFAIHEINSTLRAAETSIAFVDTVGIIQALKTLREFQL